MCPNYTNLQMGKNLKIEKSYRCNFCKKAYEKNYQLQKHIRIDHEGKKD